MGRREEFIPLWVGAACGNSGWPVMVAARDGVELATDVYRPGAQGVPSPGRLPVLLHRTPYDKSAAEIVKIPLPPWVCGDHSGFARLSSFQRRVLKLLRLRVEPPRDQGRPDDLSQRAVSVVCRAAPDAGHVKQCLCDDRV